MLIQLLKDRVEHQISWRPKGDHNSINDPYGKLIDVKEIEGELLLTVVDVKRRDSFAGDWSNLDNESFQISSRVMDNFIAPTGEIYCQSMDGTITFRVFPYRHETNLWW